jgi:broad specificity phosphatase PhoE
MKTIYLVRHGETRFNKDWRHQHPAVDLSPKGWKQAERAGEYAKTLGLDVIITSDFLRARQTAEVISGKTGIAVEVSEEFREIQRPSSVWGKQYHDPRSLWAMTMILLHSSKPDWRYSDEESVALFQERIITALHLLEQRQEEHIAVVTHRGFISGLLSILKKETLPHGAFGLSLARALSIDNCSFTTITYDEAQKKWGIVEVNKNV